MKKIIIITLLLILCGCESRISKVKNPTVDYINQLSEVGYFKNFSDNIEKLSDETKELLLQEYNPDLEKLIKLDNINDELIKEYLKKEYDVDTFIYLINKDYINTNKMKSFKKFYNDKYFMIDNTDLYFKYEKEFKDIRSLIEYVNSKAYKRGYEEYEEADLSKGNLIIASKIYYLGNYEPTDLVDVEDGYYMFSKPQLRKEVWLAYKEMSDAARLEEQDFYITSAYRSYDYQVNLYNKYLETDPQEVVDTYSSRPGFSDHQTGLTVDIRTKDKAFDTFIDAPEAKWLEENAYKYGFILRYPKEKETVTGYIYESWHFRYVGKDIAKIIYDEKLTFEEYYNYYVEK